MAEIGPVGITQPTLAIEPEILAGLRSGKYVQLGGVIRNAKNGQIRRHLPELEPDKIADEAAKRVAAKRADTNPWIIVTVVLLAAAGLGAGVYYLKRKKAAAGNELRAVEVDHPECVTNFDASLRSYVEAARIGELNDIVVDRLITDLDALRAWVDEGNGVTLSFEQLEPLFSLVIGHTHALANAYSVELDDIGGEGDAGTVLQLRHHLETQKRILAGAA